MPVPRAVLAWLTRDADPSVRLRVYRGLLGRDEQDPAVRGARRQIGREGWAAKILGEQLPRGQWATPAADARSLYVPKYIATNWRLIVLAELGARGADPRVRRAVDLFLKVYATPRGNDLADSEACFSGNAVRLLTLLGRGDHPAVQGAIRGLVRRQKRDGGWHCFPSRTGTLDAWEPLAAFSVIPPAARSAAVDRAIARGAEFFLERRLLREGRGDYAPWRRLHYPNHYYYDVLVGLSTLVRLGYASDRRLRPALELLERKRRPDGRWNLDAYHPDFEGPGYGIRSPFYPFALERAGEPSRWITVGALEVLQACGRL